MSSDLQRRIALLEQDALGDNLQAELAAAREYYSDLLGFVMRAFPWGQPGTPLEKEEAAPGWFAGRPCKALPGAVAVER